MLRVQLTNNPFSAPYHNNSELSSVHKTLLSREFIANHRGVHHTRLLTNLKRSEHFIEKLSPWKVLRGHDGCVNSVLFSDNGEIIFTGSDDTNINLYSTHDGHLRESLNTIHTQNIFYAKDFPQNSNLVDFIISCAADGRVVLTNMETKGGKQLYRHRGRSHRISLIPGEPYQFVTCGEDGICCHFDLREKLPSLFGGNHLDIAAQQHLYEQLERNELPSLKMQFRPRLLSESSPTSVASSNARHAPLQSAYCIGVNPFHPYEIAVGGTHTKVALFDIRNHQIPFGFLCPEHLLDSHAAHVTGLKYSYTGQYLLASYNDDDVYSFHIQRHTRLLPQKTTDSATGILSTAYNAMNSLVNRFRRQKTADELQKSLNKYDPSDEELDGDLDSDGQQGFYRRFTGHRNSDTVKQVAYMGNQSEWVVSGSDCGHIFIWNAHTSKLTKVMYGDSMGAINCLASHPHLPLLATSGLENNAKLWYPLSDAKSIEKDEEEKEKVDSIIRSNREREDDGIRVNSRVLRRLIQILAQSAYDEAEEEEEEEEEGDETTTGIRRSSAAMSGDDTEGQQRRRQRRLSFGEIRSMLPMLPMLVGFGARDLEFVESEDSDSEEDAEHDEEQSDGSRHEEEDEEEDAVEEDSEEDSGFGEMDEEGEGDGTQSERSDSEEGETNEDERKAIRLNDIIICAMEQDKLVSEAETTKDILDDQETSSNQIKDCATECALKKDG